MAMCVQGSGREPPIIGKGREVRLLSTIDPHSPEAPHCLPQKFSFFLGSQEGASVITSSWAIRGPQNTSPPCSMGRNHVSFWLSQG